MVDGEGAAGPPGGVIGATLVVVAYGVDALSLDWVPESAPVVVVHNDDRLDDKGDLDRPDVTHLHPGSNIGFGAGVNAALDMVTTPRVVLCNPDVRADRLHWEALESTDPDELVVVRQVDASGRPASVVNRYPTPAAVLLTAARVGRLAPRGSRRRRALSSLLGRWGRTHAGSMDRRPAEPAGPADSDRYRLAEHWPSAALVSLDTSLLRRVGGFDEDYFLYWEDVDLARRLAEAAPRAVVTVAPVVPAVHLVGGSAGDEATRRAVVHERWRSAARYAAGQRGARWRVAAGLLSAGAAVTSRGVGARDAPVPSPGPATGGGRPVVAVVHATRRPSGEVRRLESWLDLLEAAGYDAVPVAVLTDRPGGGTPRPGWCGWRAVAEVVRGTATPESLAWSRRRATEHLAALDPAAVLCVTLRAYAPTWSDRWPVVLDLVDPLSQSYRQRAGLARGTGPRIGFTLLAGAAGRAEARASRRGPTVAAGWTDSRRLGIPWIPITVPAHPPAPSGPRSTGDGDRPRWAALFFGSLDYLPNVDAVRRLTTAVWPAVRALRPDAVLGIAGRRATPEVEELTRNPGVELIGGFDDLADLTPRTQVAVSPLRHATGFQIKVLDAAAHGVAQVVSPVALSGFAPGLSVLVGDSDEEIADAVVGLLADPEQAASLAERARAEVVERYGVAAWAPVVARLVGELVAGRGQDRVVVPGDGVLPGGSVRPQGRPATGATPGME